MTGTIVVLPLSNTLSQVRIFQENFEASYNLSSNNNMEGDYEFNTGCGSCHNLTTSFLSTRASPLFVYSLCHTPIVNGIHPGDSTLHSTITLYGSGFGTVDSNRTTVMFGSHSCTLLSPYTNTQIRCTINALSQPTPFLFLPLTLYIANTGLGLVLNNTHRGLVIKPVITSLSPNKGSVLGGNILTISGASFVSSGLQVYIGNNTCMITSVTYNSVQCMVPPMSGNSNSSISINVTYGDDKGVVCSIEGGCNYEYLADYTPSIRAVYPLTIGGNEDTLATITGTLLTSDTLVTIGPYNCTNVRLIDSDNITCFIQPIQASRYRLSILVPTYGYATFEDNQDSFITSVLRVDSFTPQAGSIRGGTILTLTGIGFSDYLSNNSITISHRPCIVSQSNYTTVVCSTPDLGREGTHSIEVTVAMHPGRFKRNVDTPLIFTYDLSKTPRVTSVHPSSGQQGDTIVIKGTGFTDTASVSIGGSICTVSSQPNHTDIICVLGAHYVGRHLVEVLISDKGKAAGSVYFNYKLQVNSISPTMSSFAGQNTLTVSGIGFNPLATFITICSRQCTSSTVPPSLTSITCIVPSFTDLPYQTNDNTRTCDVHVTSLLTTISLPGAYTFSRALTPNVTSINRTRGGTGGGSVIAIKGTGFNGNVTVTIAGVPCAVQLHNESMINCVTGRSGRTIKAPVMVYIDGKGYAVSTAEPFYYVDLWSSQYTWGGEGLPREGDFVIVPAGQTLVLDIRTPILSILLIQGGELIFDDDQDGIELHSENILITDGGRLQIGTEHTPHQHKAQIVMYGNRVSTELPLFGAKTLAVRNGTLDLHGKPIMNTWTCLSSTVRAGERVLTVKHNVSDWEVGGLIVIASTSYSRRENEELTIESISNDGRSITVTTPLQYTHISVTQTINGKVIETCAEVGYLTRNIVVRGNRNTEWDRNFTNCEDNFNPGQFEIQTCFNGRYGAETVGDQFGSQIMLHKGPKDKVVGRLSYIEVTHAGQAFRLGRYPIHFHLNGDVSSSYVRGCSIHHTFNRAVSIHGVTNLLVEKNVAYNIMGHAYFLEDGIEEGNIIQYNLGIFIRASSSLLNVDITPATFWSVNPNNVFRHNAAAGGTHFGFWYHLHAIPTSPTSVRSIYRPMKEFNNNTAHSFGWYGIWIFPSYYPGRQTTCYNVTPAVFENFLAWRNIRGVEFSEIGAVQLKHSIMLDNTLAGVDYTKVTSAWGKKGALIEDVLIVGHSGLRYADDAGMRNSVGVCTSAGIKTPHSYYLTVSNITLVNFNESGCYALQACSHCRPNQGGFESYFENTVLVNSPNVATWKWEHEHVFRDITGHLTGIVGGSLVPTSNILPYDRCTHHSGSSFGPVNGSVCEADVHFTRFGLRNPTPSSLTTRLLQVSNRYGTTELEYVHERLMYGQSYIGLLPLAEIYELQWDGGERFVNISYQSVYSGLAIDDYLWMRHDVINKSVDSVTINNEQRNASAIIPPAGSSVLGDWHVNANKTIVTYYVRGNHPTCPGNVELSFSSYQCYFKDCIPPPPPEPPTPRPTGRPNVTQLWSNSSTWPDGQLPVEGSDVYVDCNDYVLVDVPFIPSLNVLTICGGLEFLDDRDHFIQAHRILIDRGQLIAGRNETPFQHKLTILLNGNLSSHEYQLPNLGPVLGAKAIGVFGNLSLHGQERAITWTVLGQTATIGSTQIILKDRVDWMEGEEIVIASTSYEIQQTEERTIVSVSSDGKTLTLDRPLVYNHLGGSHNTEHCQVNISAEVGLLSRNIKILGTHPNATTDVSAQESYGCRVLVSTYYNSTLSASLTGRAQLSGVEFKGCGQEGFVESFDPRYSLAFLSTGTVQDNSSYIKSCSFHNGHSTGIGIYGANNMMIANNVVHHTVGPSFYITGSNHVLRDNLAVVALFPGTYRVPNEPFNDKWTANYELVETSNLILIGNSAAGGAKAGFHTNGENCIGSDFTPLWRDNIAHSTLHGVHVGYDDGHTNGDQIGCSAFHKFTVYSCYHYGFFCLL